MRIPLLGASAALLLTGCADRWLVITASGPPSALAGKTSFSVTNDWSKLSVGGKTEASYLSEKDEESKKNWAGDKDGMKADLLKILQSNKNGWTFTDAGAGDVAITTDWTFVEPGVYTAVFNMPSQTKAQISFSIGGALVDKIEVSSYQDADLYHPSSGQRLRNCAEDAANQVLQFLAKVNSGK